MISERMKTQFQLWGGLILVFYVVCFGFLELHSFEVWVLSPFIESLIGVFMGAGAIGVITGVILIFQSSIQAEQEKKQEVFKEKIKLYSLIIDEVKKILDDGKVSDSEDLEILSLELKVSLLSNPETYKNFVIFRSNFSDDKGNINTDYLTSFMEFVYSARDDLEVQQKMTIEQLSAFKKTQQKSLESAEEKYQKVKFKNINEMLDYKFNQGRIIEKIASFIRNVYEYLSTDTRDNINFKFSPSYLSIYKNGKVILAINHTKSSITIEHRQEKLENTGIEYLEGFNLKIEWDKYYKYYKVKFEEQEEFDKCKKAIKEYLHSK